LGKRVIRRKKETHHPRKIIRMKRNLNLAKKGVE